jgi:nucleoside-diphosphate-sugar epimerase
MTHLILGSAGQIGSHLVDYLKRQGENILTMDIESSEWEDLRIQDNIILEEYLEECDIVYFLAFDVGGAKYLEENQDKHQFIANNMRIMTNTFELLKTYNKPFIFASSQMAEMGYSSYGMLKALGEKITRDLGGLVVKFWNVYGL